MLILLLFHLFVHFLIILCLIYRRRPSPISNDRTVRKYFVYSHDIDRPWEIRSHLGVVQLHTQSSTYQNTISRGRYDCQIWFSDAEHSNTNELTHWKCIFRATLLNIIKYKICLELHVSEQRMQDCDGNGINWHFPDFLQKNVDEM